MTGLRRLFPLIASIGLVLAMGVVGLLMTSAATTRAQDIHREDRVVLEKTLAGLGNQYFQFALKEANDFASTQRWSFRRDDAADRALLQRFVQRSAFLQHGAAIVGLTGEPLSQFSKPPGLPAATDAGYQPLRLGLLARGPGFSSVMNVSGVYVVALAVPILDGVVPQAIFVGYFRTDQNPLQTYNERLRLGKTGHNFLVDSRGGVIASSDPSKLGTVFPTPPVLGAVQAGETGSLDYARAGTRYVAAYSPIGLGGWGTIGEQTADEFLGPIRSGYARATAALLGILVVAAAALALLNHKRQTALRHAYEYKGQLLANTTHELKTPLTAIRGSAMTLGTRWRVMPPQQVDEFLGIVHRRCDGLGKLIDRILMGARLEAGREISVSPKPTDLGATLRGIATEFEDASPRHHVQVEAAPVVWARVDPESLDQVVGLLVENAIKYSPDGGQIRIRAEQKAGYVEVRVSDEGIGISEEDRQHIFEPYFKASRGDAQSFGGVGLGLSIARHLVHRHGGEMDVVSIQGKGSTFSFTLPACEPPAQHATVDLVGMDR